MSLAADPPLAHCPPHPPQRLRTDSRKEAGKKLVLLADCLPGSKSETKEGKAHMRIPCASIAVLAVYDFRFLGMHREATNR